MGWSIASASKLSEEVDSTQVLYIGLVTYNLTNKINLLKKNYGFAFIQNIAAVLIIYLPRRGLIEVWSPEQKNKVTEVHVSKHGTIIRSAYACLDDGFPKKRDSVR